ncbi:hypothetical protein RchiOBHm_Chr5g0066041 [Rosa chinensis]|uniref:Uncharacterized protein n=1 Tax=Rosa chinensis TaxID=74649 RepID=A0A2P6QJ43_ROSCH|nr:hypothetical protein RchiOBHm_Chr5g0066041 [Rosa chinensis]
MSLRISPLSWFEATVNRTKEVMLYKEGATILVSLFILVLHFTLDRVSISLPK